MSELTFDEVDFVSGCGRLGNLGLGLIAFGGAAALLGAVPVGAVAGIAGAICVLCD